MRVDGVFRLRGLALALVAVQAGAPLSAALRNVKIGDQIPAFAVKALEGKELSKTTYRGKVLLLIFARPEHEKSLEALVAAQRIARDYTNTKLTVLAVSTKPNAGDYFRGIVAEHGISFPVALDPERKMYGDYGLIVSPTTLLIDEAGVLRHELPHTPPNFERRLRTHADLLLGKIDRQTHNILMEEMRHNAPPSSASATGNTPWLRR